MTFREKLLKAVEDYLEKTRMPVTTFGRLTMNNPNFVKELRSGRAPSIDSADKIMEWIRSKKA